MTLLIQFILQALSLIAIGKIIPGITVANFTAALIFVVILSLINLIAKPILVILTLPITLVTLGLFIFVINFVIFWFASSILKGISFANLSSLFLAWLLFSLLTTLISSALKS